jgi:carboxyl-terminal processing protease
MGSDPYIATHIADNTLHIKLRYFDKGIYKKVKTTLEKIDNQINNIVIDLRDNPGGVFIEAVKIVDMFIDKGMIVASKQKNNTRQYFASKKATITKLPLTILVNNKTASSAAFLGSDRYI